MTPTAQNDVDTGKASNTSQHLCAASKHAAKKNMKRNGWNVFFLKGGVLGREIPV